MQCAIKKDFEIKYQIYIIGNKRESALKMDIGNIKNII